MTDLREYWRAAQQDYPGTRIFLLRNLTRGAEIGFFRERGFYPDFILWLMTGRKQHVVFVEPHGMMRAPAYGNDEKARLHERLPGIARQAARRAGRSDVTLDSYMVSATSFATLRKRYDSGDWTEEKFAQKHILFFPGHQTAAELAYIERIFRDQLGRAQKASAVA